MLLLMVSGGSAHGGLALYSRREAESERGLVAEADRRGCSSVTEDRKPETQADKGRG